MKKPMVVIAGAGPAGLTASLLLARRNVPVTVIERHRSTSTHPKARGVNVRTMEILRSLGLEPAVRAAGSKLAKSRYMLQVESLAGKELQRFEEDELMITGEALGRYTPCSLTMCSQDELESLLLREATKAGVSIRFGCQLAGFTQHSDRVTCRVTEGASGETYSIDSAYLLGCDGSNSFVRKTLGIPLEGKSAMEHFVNVHFRADLQHLVADRWFGICFVENPRVQGIFLPVNNTDEWLFNMQFDPARTNVSSLTADVMQEHLRSAIGVEDLQPEILSVLPWNASAVVASRMREGRVFLVGDAAHIMPPAGAFGLNTAVQDAHNLAWKLAAALETGSECLLDSYEQERLPVARSVVHYSAEQMDAPQPWEAGASDEELSNAAPQSNEGGPGPWEMTLEEQLREVIGFQYSSVCIEEGPKLEGLAFEGQPGTRFPHVALDEGRSTLDLLPESFAVFTGRLESEAERTSLPVIEVAPMIWKKMSGQSGASAFLVRPDGIVCARGTLSEVLQFHERLFCSSTPSQSSMRQRA